MTWPHAWSGERRVPIPWARVMPFPPFDASPHPNRTPLVDPNRIISEVARKHRLDPRDMRGGPRFQERVIARHEAMWRMRTELNMTFQAIAYALGLKDHSTALHGVRRHEQRLRGC